MYLWLKWYEGSAPLFWIRPEVYQYQACDGVQPWIREAPPILMISLKQEKDPVEREKVYGKLNNIVLRGYLT